MNVWNEKKYVLMGLGLMMWCSSGACTDARMAKLKQFGSPQEITCYSGGQQIYHGFSTGKVTSEENSDGYVFQERDTNRLIEISADCIFWSAE